MVRRLGQVLWTLLDHHIDGIGSQSCLSRVLLGFWPSKRRKALASMPDGERLVAAFEKLGPIFIKFGQMLSTRYEYFDTTTLSALSCLQDDVPPFSAACVEQVMRQALGRPIEEVFSSWNQTPLASASVAQVHEAVLKESGDVVVIKVLRPRVAQMIRKDLRLLRGLLLLSGRWSRFHELLDELEQNFKHELDLMREGSNASTLKRHFADTDALYIPKVYWAYTSEKMLVLEKVEGVRVDDVSALKKAQVDLPALAKKGVELFFTQILRDAFFHADMHPGNVMVDISNPQNPTFVLVDFGIVGSLNRSDQYYIASNLLAFFNQDYQQVAQLHVASGWISEEARVDQFASDIRSVCEPIFALPLKDISFSKLFFKLIKTAKAYQVDIQPQLFLLQKTLFMVESLGRRLDPDLNLWEIAKPCLEHWMRERVGLKMLKAQLAEAWPLWLECLPKIPEHLMKSMECSKPKVTKQTRTYSHAFVYGALAMLVITLWR